MTYEWKHLRAIAEKEVVRTIAALPPKLRHEARQLPVTFETRPGPALIADGVEEDTLGLFVGDAYPDHDVDPAPLPPQILLFLENLWDLAEGDEAEYRREIRTTLFHELGHYLGLDETDLGARGLE